MKCYTFPAGVCPVNGAIYLTRKVRYPYDLKLIKLHGKNYAKEQSECRDVEYADIGNLDSIENEQNIEICIINDNEIIRHPMIISDTRIYLHCNDLSDESLLNSKFVYDMYQTIQRKKVPYTTLFMAIGQVIDTDYREVAKTYYDNTDTLDISLTDDLLFDIFGVSLNIDVRTRTQKVNFIKIYRSSSPGKVINVLLDETLDILSGHKLIFVADETFSMTCSASINCMSTLAGNKARHESKCTEDVKITFAHAKIAGDISTKQLLVQEKYCKTNESIETKEFIFINFVKCLDKDHNEYILAACLYSNIGGIIKTRTAYGPEWKSELISFIKRERFKYQERLIDNSSPKCREMLFTVKREKRNNGNNRPGNKCGDYKLKKFFRNLWKLKIITNSLNELADISGQLSNELEGDFKLTNKGGTVIAMKNTNFRFSHLTTFLTHDQTISELTESWLGEEVLALPKTLIYRPSDNTFPTILNLSERKCLAENERLFLNTNLDIEVYILDRSEVITSFYHKVTSLMSKYIFDYFDTDLFHFNTISSIAYRSLMISFDNKSAPFHTFDQAHEFYAKAMRSACTGGLNFCIKRHMTTSNDPIYPQAAQFTPNGEKINRITAFDINSQYIRCFQDPMPCGTPIYYKKADSGYFKSSFGACSNVFSRVSLEWLEYESLKRGLADKGLRIMTAINTGEYRYRGVTVDGFLFMNGNHFFQFNGCYIHWCPICYPINEKTVYYLKQRDKHLSDKRNSDILREGGELYIMWECQWKKIKREDNFIPQQLFLRPKITEEDLLSNKFFGFLHVHLEVDPEVRKKLQWIQLPLLFDKREIDKKSTVVPSQRCTMLMYTPLLQFFVAMGVNVVSVEYGIGYTPDFPFVSFSKNIERLRQRAYDDQNLPLTNCVKLIGNSAIGRLGLRIDRFCRTEVWDMTKNSYARWSPKVRRVTYLSNNRILISIGHKKKEDKVLTHVYAAVLALSKKQLYEKIFGLAMLSRPGALSLAYCDTDSFTIGYRDNGSGLVSIISAKHMNAWKEFEGKHFVMGNGDEKKLGLLKIECDLDNGQFLCHSNKQYIFVRDENIVKQASAGVKSEISKEAFILAIYKAQSLKITEPRYQNSNNCTALRMRAITILKTAYKKGHIMPNKVDIISFDDLHDGRT